ncbi:MAG: WD40 repeat domain-containing protein [Candidatus Poribacteria bacterium]|nr:WD40 repeat domain-containing protein [Candidatus Poribacteria bacterium]
MFDTITQTELPSSLKDRINRKQINVVTFSPNGKQLAAGGEERIWVYDLDSGKQTAVLSGHSDRIRVLAYAPDCRTLASSSEDSTLRLWDINSSNEIATILGESSNLVNVLASSPDGVPLTAWNEETARLLSNTTADPSRIRSLTFSNDGKTVVSGSVDGKIRIWEIETGRQLSSFSAHDGLVLALSFSPNGKLLASGGSDTAVRLWELESKHLLATFTAHSDSVYILAFSPDGEILVSGGRDPEIRLWNVAARGLMSTIPIQEGFIWEMAFIENSENEEQRLVSVSRDGTFYNRI